MDIHTHHHVLVSTIDLQLFMRLWREKQVEIISDFLVRRRENMQRFQHKPAFTPKFKMIKLRGVLRISFKDRRFKDADLKIVDADQFVQTSGHHHLPQDGHDSNSMTVALIDPHQLACLYKWHMYIY